MSIKAGDKVRIIRLAEDSLDEDAGLEVGQEYVADFVFDSGDIKVESPHWGDWLLYSDQVEKVTC